MALLWYESSRAAEQHSELLYSSLVSRTAEVVYKDVNFIKLCGEAFRDSSPCSGPSSLSYEKGELPHQVFRSHRVGSDPALVCGQEETHLKTPLTSCGLVRVHRPLKTPPPPPPGPWYCGELPPQTPFLPLVCVGENGGLPVSHCIAFLVLLCPARLGSIGNKAPHLLLSRPRFFSAEGGKRNNYCGKGFDKESSSNAAGGEGRQCSIASWWLTVRSLPSVLRLRSSITFLHLSVLQRALEIKRLLGLNSDFATCILSKDVLRNK